MALEDMLTLGRARRLARDGRARKLRERAGLKQVWVARAVGASQSLMNHWEAGRKNPAGDAGIRYGRLLDALLTDARA